MAPFGLNSRAGEGGKWSLICSLCSTGWEFPSILCPVCGGRRSIFWDVAARRNNGRSFASQFEERYGSRRGFAVFPSESRTEGGRRQESEDPRVEIVRQAVIWSCLRGFCRLPRSMAGSGNGKIVRQEQPGAPARNPPNRRPEAGRR